MIATIDEIISQNPALTTEEIIFKLREFIQSIILIGLSRAGFFEYASFYGGCALRIFYGLTRYSDDLDFTLNKPNECFNLQKYFGIIKEVALSYGFALEISTKTKKTDSVVESAFAKLNTYQTFIQLKANEKMLKLLHKNEMIKVKFKIDCNPSLGFDVETKWIVDPEFAAVNLLNPSSLFSGKIYAILCRNYKNTVKGRDYFDFLFYISKNILPNMNYLRNKLIESNKILTSVDFNKDYLKNMLKERFEQVYFEEVKKDAERFLIGSHDISFYSKDFFIQMLDRL